MDDRSAVRKSRAARVKPALPPRPRSSASSGFARSRSGRKSGRRDRESDADQAPGPVVTRNAEHPDSPDDRKTAVVANAARLLSDAKLLIDHGLSMLTETGPWMCVEKGPF